MCVFCCRGIDSRGSSRGRPGSLEKYAKSLDEETPKSLNKNVEIKCYCDVKYVDNEMSKVV